MAFTIGAMIRLSLVGYVQLFVYVTSFMLGLAAWAFHFLTPNESPVPVFVLSFLAIVASADLLARATDKLSSCPLWGKKLTALTNATLGNFVEFVVAILALWKNNVDLARSLLIGSIFNKLLIELGSYYAARGLRRPSIGTSYRRTGISLWSAVSLIIAAFALFFPSLMSHFSQYNSAVNGIELDAERRDLLVSRPIAIIFLCVYAVNLFRHPHEDGVRTTRERPGLHLPTSPVATSCSRPDLSMRRLDINTGDSGEDSEAAHFVNENEGSGDDSGGEPSLGARAASRASELQDDGRNSGERKHFRGFKRSEEAKNVTGAFIAVVLLAAFIGFTAEIMVHAMESMTKKSPLPEDYLTRIALPLVGNFAEIFTAVLYDSGSPEGLGLEIVAQSIVQMILGVISLLVLIGYLRNVPFSFVFDLADTIVLMIAAMAAFAPLQDARCTNMFRGLILISLFLMYALSLWYYSEVN